MPKEWLCPDLGLVSAAVEDDAENSQSSVEQGDKLFSPEVAPVGKKKRVEKKKYGPIEVERRSTRGNNDGRSVLEKAQEIKRKWYEGDGKGTKPTPTSISSSDLSNVANAIGISNKDGSPVRDTHVAHFESEELCRGICFSESCSSCCALDSGNIEKNLCSGEQGLATQSVSNDMPLEREWLTLCQK